MKNQGFFDTNQHEPLKIPWLMGFRDLYDLISDCDARVSLSWLTWWNTHDFPEKKKIYIQGLNNRWKRLQLESLMEISLGMC